MGWVSSIRDHGNLQFVILKDLTGEIQITAKKGEVREDLFARVKELREHSSVAFKGKIRPQEKAPNGIELVPSEMRAFSVARKPPPFPTQGKTAAVGLETRLDLRAIDLRRDYLGALFRIRQTVLSSIRDYLYRQRFIEVSTPKMIATATEGGAALFPIFYYNREAFLAQSPQLYKEQLTMAFENVFEIGPIFRAEPSRTNRHLSEATSIDVEMAFADYNDVMSILERMLVRVIEAVKEKNAHDLEAMDIALPQVEMPIPRYSYSDLIDRIQESGQHVQWGDDISPDMMKSLSDERLSKFYFIIDWPTSAKPFYVKPKAADSGRVCESFDLMSGPLELSSGSTRISSRDFLVERMSRQGLKPDAFDYHLRVFDYGVPPHAGFGLGLERLLMAVAGVENIRDATLFPRDIDRLAP